MKYIILIVSIFFEFTAFALEKSNILKNELKLLEERTTLGGIRSPTLKNNNLYFGDVNMNNSTVVVDELHSKNGLKDITDNFTYPCYFLFVYNEVNKKLIPVSTTMLNVRRQEATGTEYITDDNYLLEVVNQKKEICGKNLKFPQESQISTKKEGGKLVYYIHDYCAKPILSTDNKVIGVYFVSTYYELELVMQRIPTSD